MFNKVRLICLSLFLSLILCSCDAMHSVVASHGPAYTPAIIQSAIPTPAATILPEYIRPSELFKYFPREQSLVIAERSMYDTAFDTNYINPFSFPHEPYREGTNLVYEALFAYGPIDGVLHGILAKTWEWVDDVTLRVCLYDEACWSDGTKLTAADVVYTFTFMKRYNSFSAVGSLWADIWGYTKFVEAENENTVLFTLENAMDRLLLLEALCVQAIFPEHILSVWEEDCGYTFETLKYVQDVHPISSGPYKTVLMQYDCKVLERNDFYWGVSNIELTGGKLPTPSFIIYVLTPRFKEVQAFLKADVLTSPEIPNAAEREELKEHGANIITWRDEPPYSLAMNQATVRINLTVPGLDDERVRRALAMCFDYEKANTFANEYLEAVFPSFVLPSIQAEWNLVNNGINDSLRWGYDLEGANELLDSIGAKRGSDGVRVMNGVRLGPYYCVGTMPYNIDDTFFIESAAKIGIELVFDENLWDKRFEIGPDELKRRVYADGSGLSMYWGTHIDGLVSPAVPWIRCYEALTGKDVGAEELLLSIALSSNQEEISELYTELESLYLKNAFEIPFSIFPISGISVIYNETVWTGFPKESDEGDIPPYSPGTGWAIRLLYTIDKFT